MQSASLSKTRSAQRSCGGYLFKRSTNPSGRKMFARSGWRKVDGLGIDPDGRLYWNGKPVEIIGRRLDLTWTQALFGFLVAIFTVVGGVGAAAQGWAAYHDWVCRNKRPSIIACPVSIDEPARRSWPAAD
jgi:hypothetical protein